mgnify:CR=1 FL=1
MKQKRIDDANVENGNPNNTRKITHCNFAENIRPAMSVESYFVINTSQNDQINEGIYD